MTNIWGFLLQTLSVSLVAVLLLIVKGLLADKLSQRWQYGVWSVLVLRILLPVSVIGFFLPTLPLWIETWKGFAERTLDSAYTAVYTAISIHLPIPILTGYPNSITDWLFVIYVIGVLSVLTRYLLSYFRLRMLLRHTKPASEIINKRIDVVCSKYRLRPCRAVTAVGLPTTFICGVVRPVLVLPEELETDDKVLLHELLHLKYKDALQNIIWSIFQALHWCNPILKVVFNRIGNDMEALCDQRVLELLAGEERREYGSTLMSMANDRYPRESGTTSLSNGSKNISRRIATVLRFKTYPKGIALVSVCIAFVFAFPILCGTTPKYQLDYYYPDSEWEIERAMALARIQRCTTVAGALDTYANGILYENRIYTAIASSTEQFENLEAIMRSDDKQDKKSCYNMETGDLLNWVKTDNESYVYNLKGQVDGSYTAQLAFQAIAYLESTNDLLRDEEGNRQECTILVPVTVYYENGWVVKESGQPYCFPESLSQFPLLFDENKTLNIKEYSAASETGTVTIYKNISCKVTNKFLDGNQDLLNMTSFSEIIPNAEFDSYMEFTFVEYIFGGGEQERAALSDVAMNIIPLDSPEQESEFPGKEVLGDSSWSSSTGEAGVSKSITPKWDGKLTTGSGSGASTVKDGVVVLPSAYTVHIYWNGELVEDFLVREVN